MTNFRTCEDVACDATVVTIDSPKPEPEIPASAVT